MRSRAQAEVIRSGNRIGEEDTDETFDACLDDHRDIIAKANRENAE